MSKKNLKWNEINLGKHLDGFRYKKKLAEFCRLIFSEKTLKILQKRIRKDGEDIYGTQAMFNVLPVPRMTKIFKDFYGSADFRENEITLMTKLAFGKQ